MKTRVLDKQSGPGRKSRITSENNQTRWAATRDVRGSRLFHGYCVLLSRFAEKNNAARARNDACREETKTTVILRQYIARHLVVSTRTLKTNLRHFCRREFPNFTEDPSSDRRDLNYGLRNRNGNQPREKQTDIH